MRSIADELESRDFDGMELWAGRDALAADGAVSGVPVLGLLPNYDEYLVGFRQPSRMLHARRVPSVSSAQEMLAHVIVAGGQIVGLWQRRFSPTGVVVTLDVRAELSEAERAALARAIARYERFLGTSVTVA